MRNARILICLVLPVAVWIGCAGKPPAQEAGKTIPLDRIEGKAQLLMESSGASDAALNAGGPSVYLWQGMRRYRLFLRTSADIVHGNEYVAEGIDAQKVIDDIGDPDQGRNGYPLQSSCERAVRMAWKGLSLDAADADASLLRARVKRYPARTVFLVTRIRPATPEERTAASPEPGAEEKDIPEITVAADQQRAFLMEAPKVLTAPLWDPQGATLRCKVLIGTDGKISELRTGEQLCEAAPWSQFRYRPRLERGRPVNVSTEVEVCYEARK